MARGERLHYHLWRRKRPSTPKGEFIGQLEWRSVGRDWYAERDYVGLGRTVWRVMYARVMPGEL